jgi:hypothetical protein
MARIAVAVITTINTPAVLAPGLSLPVYEESETTLSSVAFCAAIAPITSDVDAVLAAFRHVYRNGAAALARALNRDVIWTWYVKNQTCIKGHPYRAYSNRRRLGNADAVWLIEPHEPN